MNRLWNRWFPAPVLCVARVINWRAVSLIAHRVAVTALMFAVIVIALEWLRYYLVMR